MKTQMAASRDRGRESGSKPEITISCPEGHAIIPLPQNGVKQFYTNVALARAMDLDQDPGSAPVEAVGAMNPEPAPAQAGEPEGLCGNCEVRIRLLFKCMVCLHLLCEP